MNEFSNFFPKRSPSPAASTSPQADVFVPDVIKSKNRHELATLLTDDKVLTAIFESTHPIAVQQAQQVALLSKQIADLSGHILQQESDLKDKREQAAKVLDQATQDNTAWRQVESEQAKALARFSSRALHARLRSATQEADQVSEALAHSFLEGGSSGNDTGQFVREYRRVRGIYHLRKERLDRWDEERVGGVERV
ncbi:hypothetical protein V1514DRAFT_326071 [Lipomyces japonicus]|uniref:uncharacterized protein n=1 Tax=Lipomyces japonicus TaxID=56871 RepID=UPI0034CFBF8D